MQILTIRAIKGIIKEPRSRGISGALNLQSAIAGVMFGRGLIFMEQPGVSGVDIWVFHDGNPRTMSGQE